MGVETALELMETLRRQVKERKVKDPAQLKPLLQELIQDILSAGERSLNRGGPPR